MAYSTFSEIRINGYPVDWGYWYILQNITPTYGAALAYRIDPLKTKKSDDVKAIQKELQEHITRLELRLASISPSWTLTDLVIFLGDDAPEGMLYQVRTQLHKALINLLRQLAVAPQKPVILDIINTDTPEDAPPVIVKVINTEPASKIKPRNKQRPNETLELLHAALDEIEDRTGKTPSPSELVVFVLSGDFKHSNIQEYPDAGKNILIERRKLVLTNGRVLNAVGIRRRYRENIYL